jgi:DNA-binding SARP family transcriptional activator
VLELVAYLTAHHADGVLRDQINLHLFPESDRRRGSNHFRQIVHQLRKTTGLTLLLGTHGHLRWDPTIVPLSLDANLERGIIEAGRLVGPEWVSARRFALDVMKVEAELEAARLALEVNEFELARRFAARVLDRDPFVESAYHALIEVELAVGSEPGAQAVYRRSIAAFGELGLSAGHRMPDVLERLRRAASSHPSRPSGIGRTSQCTERISPPSTRNVAPLT